MKLTPFKLDVASGVVEIAAAWQPIIEQCCELKEAIDHASRWRCDTPWKQAVEKILKQHDLAITDIPSHSELNCNFPDHFARLLGGESIFSMRDQRKPPVSNIRVPGWATLGWVRKESYAITPTRACNEQISEANSLPLDASTYVVEGIPLFMASEGKNRTQIQRIANVFRETTLTLLPCRNVSQLSARPLAFAPRVLVLEFGNGYELLPFGSLSQSLLCAIGVKWSDLPSFKPWFGQALKLGKPWKKGDIENRIRVDLLKR